MLLLARQDDAHRAAAGCTREQRGVERRIVCPVVAVATGGLDVTDAHALRFDAERLRERLAQREDALRRRPHLEASVGPLCDRSRRTDRAVQGEGSRVRRADGAARAGRLGDGRHLALDRDAVDDEERLTRLLAQPARERALRRQRRLLAPPRRGRQRRGRGERLLLPLGENAQEAAVPHHGHDARQRANALLVDLFEARAAARRADNPTVQHPGQRQVLEITRGAGDDRSEVDAPGLAPDDAVPGRRFRRHAAGGAYVEPLPAEQLPVARRSPARGDRPVLDAQLARVDAELGRREPEQVRARFRGRLPQRRAALLGRGAAGGEAFVEPVRGVGGLDAHALERDVELFRTDPREHRAQPLSVLRLAAEDGDRLRRIDAHPGIEQRMLLEARRERAHAAAARRTAFTIRGCEPQRQRCGASAARISSSEGCGVRSSSAFAPTMIPGMQ